MDNKVEARCICMHASYIRPPRRRWRSWLGFCWALSRCRTVCRCCTVRGDGTGAGRKHCRCTCSGNNSEACRRTSIGYSASVPRGDPATAYPGPWWRGAVVAASQKISDILISSPNRTWCYKLCIGDRTVVSPCAASNSRHAAREKRSAAGLYYGLKRAAYCAHDSAA